MQFKEIWSISDSRIRNHFEKTYEVSFHNDTCLINKTMVIITKLSPNTIMKVPIPRCQVEISGPDIETDEIHRRFVMNFLSAGG